MNLNRMKKLGAAVVAVVTLAIVVLLPSPTTARSNEDDAPTTFKAKCVACHGAKAEKKFDTTIADEEMVKIILAGKKAEKPPNMPAYAAKGITEDQAKTLVAYMRTLKQ